MFNGEAKNRKNEMNKEASKINIQKAQDTRRLIGVGKFILKLKDYRKNEKLWEDICKEFNKHGFEVKVKE